MAYREVSVVSVREILRLWVRGHAVREIGRLTGTDRKTVTRYVEAARRGGLAQGSSEAQITDELLGCVLEAVRPARTYGHGAAWMLLEGERDALEKQIEDGLRLTKVHELLERRGAAVPYRTLHRYCARELGYGRRRATLPVADCEPGSELQMDFGRLGLVPDPASGRRRTCHALIFTAVYSRHMFVYPTHSQGLEALIAGCERAWEFFGGVFAVLIPDNMKAIVAEADAVQPKLSDAFTEYAQARGFEVDPARVRAPTDKARVERSLSYVRASFFAGESFADIADAQARAAVWCDMRAGLRLHGTTQRRPREVFEAEERPRLDGTYEAEMRKLIRVDLLILDDFLLRTLDATETSDIYEVVVERHRRASTVVTSNRDPSEWLAAMADPLLAQSAVDRLQSAAHELVVEGESYRRRQRPRRAAS